LSHSHVTEAHEAGTPTAAQREFAAEHDAHIEGRARARPSSMFVYGEDHGRAVRWLVNRDGEVLDKYYFDGP
jgi:hypothetical protein